MIARRFHPAEATILIGDRFETEDAILDGVLQLLEAGCDLDSAADVLKLRLVECAAIADL